VFNVAGTNIVTGSQSLTINGQQPDLNSGGIPILFNFPTAQSLTINGRLTASVLAPFADFSSNSNVSGNIIVGQVDGTSESHDDYFSGTGLPGFSTSTPEPISFLLLGGGLIAIGAIRKRRN
jgi:choice-of-anchor A domain-containing protein